MERLFNAELKRAIHISQDDEEISLLLPNSARMMYSPISKNHACSVTQIEGTSDRHLLVSWVALQLTFLRNISWTLNVGNREVQLFEKRHGNGISQKWPETWIRSKRMEIVQNSFLHLISYKCDRNDSNNHFVVNFYRRLMRFFVNKGSYAFLGLEPVLHTHIIMTS